MYQIKNQKRHQGFLGKRILIALLIVMVFTYGAIPALASTPDPLYRSHITTEPLETSETVGSSLN